MRGHAAGALMVCLSVSVAEAQTPQSGVDTRSAEAAARVEAPPRSGHIATGSGFWIQGGIGLGSPLIGGVVAASYRRERHVFSARAAATAADIEGDGDEVWDAGVLYGRALGSGRGRLSGAVGLGGVGYEAGGYGPRRTGIGVGIPMEMQASWWPIPVAGIGLYTYANLNGLRPMAGVALTLQLGVP
jgi:hypothetical protein